MLVSIVISVWVALQFCSLSTELRLEIISIVFSSAGTSYSCSILAIIWPLDLHWSVLEVYSFHSLGREINTFITYQLIHNNICIIRQVSKNFMGNCESRNAGTWNEMRNGSKMQSAPEIRSRHDERACAHCEGAHRYRKSILFSLQVQAQQPSLFISLSV